MKKKFLLLIPVTCMLFSCDFKLSNVSIFGWRPFKNNETSQNDGKKNESDVNVINDVDPDPISTHATSVSADPNAPFYMLVGETKTIKMTLSPSPTLVSEKTFTWTQNNDFVSLKVDSSNTAKATITAMAAGTTVITAKNDYNETLYKTFTINVLDVNPEDIYLWQYNTEDRKQFGYDYNNAKQGEPIGTAVLNDQEWSYTRSKASSLQSKYGAIGFGKGNDPETLVHLETETDRIINKIVIETASSNSLAKLTVKVGDEAMLDHVTVGKTEYDVIGAIQSSGTYALQGKISIDFETPAYDVSKADDPSYLAPGAVYLKSILIYYQPEVTVGIEVDENSEHKTDFIKGQPINYDGLKLNKISDRGVKFPVDIDEELDDKNLTILPAIFDTASHESQTVSIKLKVVGYENPFETSYEVHVREREWRPESITIQGEVAGQLLTAGDTVDYSGLIIHVVYDSATNDYTDYHFSEYDSFIYQYGDNNDDPFVAEVAMMNQYTIRVYINFGTVDEPEYYSGTYVVPAGTLNVTPAIYDRINFKKSNVLEELDLKTSVEEKDYSPTGSRIKIHFDGVKKGSKTVANPITPVLTNKTFTITSVNTSMTIDKVNLEFANSTLSTNPFTLSESVFGGSIFGDPVVTLENNLIVYKSTNDYVNCVSLDPGKTETGSDNNKNMAIVRLVVRYKECEHIAYEITSRETSPTKMIYNEGETFDPTGLTIMLNSEYENTSIDVTSMMKWYDGATYSTKPQERLTSNSTYVVGVFNDKTININITSVSPKAISLSRVYDPSEFVAEGKYYITCPELFAILKGSTKNGDLLTGKGCAQQEMSFNDKIELNMDFEYDYFYVTPTEGGKYTISTETGFIGLTKGGSATCSGSCPNRDFSITIDNNGICTIEITAMAYDTSDNEKGEVTNYLGGNSGTNGPLIKLYKDNKANVAIYKVN